MFFLFVCFVFLFFVSNEVIVQFVGFSENNHSQSRFLTSILMAEQLKFGQ